MVEMGGERGREEAEVVAADERRQGSRIQLGMERLGFSGKRNWGKKELGESGAVEVTGKLAAWFYIAILG
jgi:hypothetical protein